MMRELVEWLQMDTEIHPVLVAGIAQFQLVHIHPFVDGNGRTSRLLSTLCLYQRGYDFKRLFTISEYYERDRSAFYKAIQSLRENNMDLTSWLDYFVTGLATQLDEVKNSGTKAIKLDLLIKEHGLNARQYTAMEHLLENERLTITDYEALFPRANRRTLQRDLKNLLEAGVVEEVGSGTTDPTRYYRLLKL